MRIFYVNVIEENAGWGAEYFVNRGFRALGHETYCLDYRKNRYRLHRHFVHAPPADVFFLQRGDYFPLALVKSVQVPRFFWASELVSRCRDQDRLLRSGLFRHIFFHSSDCIQTAVSRGWIGRDRCSVLLNGFDETFHRPIPGSPRDIEVLFVGSLSARRKAILDKLRPVVALEVRSAFAEDLVRVLNRAKIVLNIHAAEPLDTETRIFEALGCGRFVLTERLSVDNPFSSRELVQFESIDDLIDKIRYYLAHEQERERIARQGHESALKAHTYTHRAGEICESMARHAVPNEGTRASTPLARASLGFTFYGLCEHLLRPYGRVRRQIGRLTRPWRLKFTTSRGVD